MRKFGRLLAMVVAVMASALVARAESGTLEVSASYRERIALPPDAQLEVTLFDASRADAGAMRIASQRFAMTGVPMTVSLAYDPGLVGAETRLVLTAAVWSGDRKMFALPSPQVLSGVPNTGPVEMLLVMVPDTGAEGVPAGPITGIAWRVTEVLGEAWSGDDPATLVIDDDRNFSIFGGCNRFMGQVTLAGNDMAFPADFAGTLMACPDAVEARERRFLQALRRVAHHARYGAGLLLMDEGGNALLHFEPDLR